MGSVTVTSHEVGRVPFPRTGTFLLLYLTFGVEGLKSPLRNFQRRGQFLQ